MELRVLLVEDNPDHALLTKRTLERDARISYVKVCSEAGAALEFLSKNAEALPNLILLDIRLPGISGVDLLDKIKAIPAARSIPVVLLSSFASESQVNEGIERGASAFIMKPLRVKDLMARLSIDSNGRPKRPTGWKAPANERTQETWS